MFSLRKLLLLVEKWHRSRSLERQKMASLKVVSYDHGGRESLQVTQGIAAWKRQAACARCRRLHRKCQLDQQEDKVCKRCLKAKAKCLWDDDPKDDGDLKDGETYTGTPKRQPSESFESVPKRQRLAPDLTKDEHIYAKVLQSTRASSQFITATQPLAPILSRDSVLSLDGEVLGLYCPWRNVYFEPRGDRNGTKIDPELKSYLDKKGAFVVPQLSEQRRLIKIFLDNVYPLYPVVSRNVLDNLHKQPLLLLNAMMLAGVRYDKTLKGMEFRIRAQEFRSRCLLLEMIENNKVTMIQSYLLLSLNEEGPEGANCAREYISKAIMLILELGIHNLAVSEHFDMMRTDKADMKTMFRLNYDKNLMVRLFWTSYCCDRIYAATSCTAMLYNVDDLIIEEPFLKNFDAGDYQIPDYEIFKRWYSLILLFERVIKRVYRPPGRRTTNDNTIEIDLLNWGIRNLNATLPIESKFLRFLKISHAYGNLLYLRCKIGLLDLIEANNAPTFHSNDSPLSSAGMYYLNKFSTDIIECLKSYDDSIEHIINIHSLLHVLVLIHLEMESKRQVASDEDLISSYPASSSKLIIEILKEKEVHFNECLELLKQSRGKYWFSAASFNLFETLSKTEAPPKIDIEAIFGNQQNNISTSALNTNLAQWS